MSASRRFRREKEPVPDEEGDEASVALTDSEIEEGVADMMGDTKEVPGNWRDLVEGRLTRLLGATRKKGAEDRKTVDEVFDKSTLLVLWKFISNGLIETLDYPLSTGKEANVFHATTRDGGALAVKIFRTNTATFRSFMTYIHGDPRFGNVGHDRRGIVHAWTQKEYKNLQRYFEAGVRVPQPVAYRENVLLMDFIGHEGTPAPLAKDLPPEDPQAAYEDVMAQYRLGLSAGLVHGDLSEFNLLNHGGELVIIDVAQAVLTRHPMANELVERDARNLARWFRRLGVDTTPEKARAAMTPPKPPPKPAADGEADGAGDGDEE